MLRSARHREDLGSSAHAECGAVCGGSDSLDRWLAEGYAPAYRTACLILRNPADAEEAVQEAFLRAWRFRAAIPPGDGVRPWLYRVVVNACLSRLRSERSRRRCTDAFADLAALTTEDEPGPEAVALRSDVQATVLDALERLPEHLRVVVVLRYYAQLNEREIAAAIHRRPGTVKSRLHDAKALLGSDPRLRLYDRVGAAAGHEGGAADA